MTYPLSNDEVRAQLEDRLRKAGIKVAVTACGCCGGPNVTYIEEETEAKYDLDYFRFNTIKEKENEDHKEKQSDREASDEGD